MIRDTGKLNFKRKQYFISRITVYSLENNFFETWTLLSGQHFIYTYIFFKAMVKTCKLYEILQISTTHHQCLPAWPSTQNAEYLNKNRISRHTPPPGVFLDHQMWRMIFQQGCNVLMASVATQFPMPALHLEVFCHFFFHSKSC